MNSNQSTSRALLEWIFQRLILNKTGTQQNMDKYAVPKFRFYQHIFIKYMETANYFEITSSMLSYSNG